MFVQLSAAAPAAGGFDSSSILSFAIIPVLIVVFYFFMIRPENKKKKKIEEMRKGIAVGDEITTVGGMVGKIVSIKDDFITFETGADQVRIQVARWAISTTGKEASAQPQA